MCLYAWNRRESNSSIRLLTDDDNVGEEAYRPDEDIFNNEDMVLNWGSQQPSGTDKGHTLDR